MSLGNGSECFVYTAVVVVVVVRVGSAVGGSAQIPSKQNPSQQSDVCTQTPPSSMHGISVAGAVGSGVSDGTAVSVGSGVSVGSAV
jgi:hypothetical protein